MTGDRVAAIAGVAESDLGEVAPKTAMQLQAEAAREALAEAGLTFADVDALLSAGGEGYAPSMALGEYLGIRPRYTDSTNIGGSSFVAHAGHAYRAIQAGLCEVALITYGSTQRSAASRTLGRGGGVRGSGQFEGVWGLPLPVGAYALAATRHMHEYGTTSEQLAELAVATRAWAVLNPKAFMRDPITVDDVLCSRWIAEPLHLLDCCLVTDGGGAVVIVSAARARDLPKPPVWILGHGESHTHLGIASMPDLTTTPAEHSGAAAFAMAGVRPADVDVAELYDSFTITVLLTLEALGFCGRGESGAFVTGGRTGPGGEFPVNTNGGGLSYCHPGMYGIFTLIEATRQLRGECGPRQVDGARVALANGTGGVLSSAATVVLGRD
ncbi:MAG TPA: acetyl-CoA acetyltransferase [Candidatus Dormibacteraeota bacterium]|nr:acetyl-CoA acetyltransferase [Candidatus Dormibacteraeota bacterium]